MKAIRSMILTRTKLRNISGVEKLDIRTKLFIVAVFTTLGICYQNIEILLLLLLANIIVNLLLKVSFRIKGLDKIIYITCSLMIIQSFFIRGGDPVISFTGINLLTTSGALYGVGLLLRTYILLTSSLIILSCNSNELASGLIKLKVPYEIVFMLQLATRFLPRFLEEIQTTFYAIQLRGVNLKKIYRKEVLRVYVRLFIPIVFSVLQKAEELSLTADMRGFRYNNKRSLYRNVKMNNTDYAVIVLTVILSSAFIIYTF